MGTRFAGLFMLSILVVTATIISIASVSAPVSAQAENAITVTVTIRKLGITVTPTTYDYGAMNLDENKKTWNGSTKAFTIQNTGNHKENITLKGADATDGYGNTWTLAGTVGADTYVHKYGIDSSQNTEAASYTALTTSAVTVQSDVPKDAYRYMDLWIFTPSSSTETYYQYSTTVTVGVYSAE